MEKSITLLNGSKLSVALKKAKTEINPNDTDAASLKEFTLDTSGRYLTICGKDQEVHSKNMFSLVLNMYNHDLFMENAWFLLEHADEIMRDSRMMFTPIRFTNGMAYTGISGFEHPTVGAYIEWWLNFPEYSRDANEDLIWYISGSPLTGANACAVVTPDGHDEQAYCKVRFMDIARSFMDVNGRYRDVKENAEAYTLEELLIRLRGDDYRIGIVDLKHRLMEDVLTTWLNQSRWETENERDKYNRLLNANRHQILVANQKKIKQFTVQYIEKEKLLQGIENRKSNTYRDMRHELSVFGQSFLKKITGKNPNSINLQMILNFGRRELKRVKKKNLSNTN